MVASRQYIVEHISKLKIQTYRDLQMFFEKHGEIMLAIDSSIRIEKHIVENGQPLIDRNLKAKCFSILPSKTRTVTMTQASALMSDLHQHPLFKMASAATQDAIEGILEVVNKMVQGIAPARKMIDADGFLKDVHTALQYFVTCSIVEKGSKAKKQLRGHHALQQLWIDTTAKAALDDTKMELAEFETFQVFKYWLDEKQQTDLSEMVTKCLKSTAADKGGIARSSAASSSSMPHKSSAKAKLAASSDTSRANLLKFFGR